VIVEVESFTGDDHDGDVRADLLNTSDEDCRQMEIARISEYVNSESF
jgi:hypothetical protein